MDLSTVDAVRNNLFNRLTRFGALETHALIPVKFDGTIRVIIFTAVNSYSIRARIPGDSPAGSPPDDGYLGCISKSRTPRAGEEQHRGSDLPDGPLTEETWHRILCAIISHEMVKVHQAPVPDVTESSEEKADGS